MGRVCAHCGGSDIEYDQARGDAVCTACGCVLEDSIIISEVSFAEQSTGASSVIGQFVSAEGSKVPLSGSGFHHGMGKVSRDLTLAQAKKRLNNLGHMLKLNQHCIDSAFMFFKMALQLNLTRGRKSSIIDTACLYLVCRSEGTPHLLLDFSDVLQINVYSLGRAYLRLSNALHINPPAIDPCLYIHRFAHKLELGDKTHEVSMTALRLVARMKRDWIHHGRRPAGLCGAALLVAARLHNFNRSVREVARIVKLSEGTLRKRLIDFKDTASSRLTIEEFLKIDLEQEHDPPSYLEAKKKARLKVDDNKVEEIKDNEGGDGDAMAEEEEEDEDVHGFGGIKNQSVDDIIAKARFTETFLAASASISLTSNLDELAKLGEDEDNGTPPTVLPDDGTLFTDDIDDKEIEGLLLSENEVKIKSQLWFAENGDFLKERELKREKMASEKAEKQKRGVKYQKRKKEHAHQSYSNAGEAIGKMLVERRISTKLNYDVLRDLEIDIKEEAKPSVMNVKSSGETTAERSWTHVSQDSLTITKTQSGNSRLPSLTNRKHSLSRRQDLLHTQPPRAQLPAKRVKLDTQAASIGIGVMSEAGEGVEMTKPIVVEESGPVKYYDEEEGEEGFGDKDVEDLAYDDDPLLNYSDGEDYEN